MTAEFCTEIDESQLNNFAQHFVDLCLFGCSIGLIGPLGAGKTTFVRALVSNFSTIAEVSSPSYVLCNEYDIGEGRLIEHWDLYRCKQLPHELLEPTPANRLRLIEWVDIFADLTLECAIVLSLNYLNASSTRREIVISAPESGVIEPWIQKWHSTLRLEFHK